MPDENVQRALGRIEGAQAQILDKLERLHVSFGEHKQEDQRNFSSVRQLLFTKLSEQNTLREKHLSDQDEKLDNLKQDADRAKGAGWVILGLLGSVAAFIGASVLAVFNGWFSFKFH